MELRDKIADMLIVKQLTLKQYQKEFQAEQNLDKAQQKGVIIAILMGQINLLNDLLKN